MSAVHDIRLLRLLPLARTMQALTPQAAAGRCLSLSLDFALAAQQRHQISLQLVKWRVAGDDYVDHWATVLDSGAVIDLTRVQVDGRSDVLAALDGYPCNFTQPRMYPLSLLQDAYLAQKALGAGRLSSGFLRHCGARLLRHDLRDAWRQRSTRLALQALREAMRFASYVTLDSLIRGLQARATRLAMRLRSRPELPWRMDRPPPADHADVRNVRPLRKTG